MKNPEVKPLEKMYDINNVDHIKVNKNMKSAIRLLRLKIYPHLSDDELIEFNNKFSNFLKI